MKKYFEFDVVFGVIFWVLLWIVSVALVHYSYTQADLVAQGDEWALHLIRVIGYIGTMACPAVLALGLYKHISWVNEHYEDERPKVDVVAYVKEDEEFAA